MENTIQQVMERSSASLNTKQNTIILSNDVLYHLPGKKTIKAFTLAKLIMSDLVSQPEFVRYSMLRLSGYIKYLKNDGLVEYIYSIPLPRTPMQAANKSHPYHEYKLTCSGHKVFGKARKWALDVIAFHDSLAKFK
jgi:hypothetical protein